WLIVAVMVLPIGVIVIVAFSASHNLEFPPRALSLIWFGKYFGRPEWVSATVTSFQVALVAALLATTLGMLAALALLRLGSRARTAMIALLLSPMIVPAIVYGVSIYLAFARVNLVATRPGMAIAHAVIIIPATVMVIYATLQGLDESFERAAASLGADAWSGFARVTLPLIAPGVVAAVLLAFLTSFDEVVVALFLTGAQTMTLPRKMYESIRFDT